ncbi:MAG: GNAT family N-acetyltransferase, partial [Parachlamydia sp.]|nr:GNAT family N-acetyltransferase [Parachlamydia sp.]
MRLQFVHFLSQRDVIGRVAEQDGRVVGYVVYRIRKTGIELLNLAVAPEFRRAGV